MSSLFKHWNINLVNLDNAKPRSITNLTSLTWLYAACKQQLTHYHDWGTHSLTHLHSNKTVIHSLMFGQQHRF